MAETVVVVVAVGLALGLVVRAAYRALRGQTAGCSCLGQGCPRLCPAAKGDPAPERADVGSLHAAEEVPCQPVAQTQARPAMEANPSRHGGCAEAARPCIGGSNGPPA